MGIFVKFQPCKENYALVFKYSPQFNSDIKKFGAKWDGTHKVWMISKTMSGKLVNWLRQNKHKFEFDQNEKVLTDKTNTAGSSKNADNTPDQIVVQIIFVKGEEGRFAVTSEKWLDRDAYKLLINEIFNKVRLPNGQPAGSYSERWRFWTFPLEVYHDFMNTYKSANIAKLTVNPLPPQVTRYLRPKTTEEAPITPNVPEMLLKALYPFQREGLEEIIRRKGKAILADEMGLGKTIQALAAAAHYRKDWPLLIVSPSSVKFNWLVEMNHWIGEIVNKDNILVLYTGKDVEKIRNNLKVVITSYEMTTKIVDKNKHMTDVSIFSEDQVRRPRFGMVILDESHYIKSATAKRAQSTKLLCNGAARVLCLSGTPALAKPIELHSQIEVVKKDLFPNRHSFGVRYCAAIKTRYGWNYSGSDNLPELSLILSKTIMIRRLKSQVLKDLPPKLRKVIYMKVPESREMQKCYKIFEGIQKIPSGITKADFKPGELEKLSDKFKEADDSPLTIWNKWYSATGDAKIKSISEYLIEKLENENEKILVFAHHRSVIDSLEQNLSPKIKGNLIKITGSTRSDDRTMFVEKFQNDENVKCALLSITAVNMGVTLTKASTVVFAELHYTPGVMVQAEDRAHRIGRESDVNIEYLIAKNTADEWIWSLIQKKLETLKGAGLGNSAVEEKHDNLKQEDENDEENDGFDDDDEFDDIVAELDNEASSVPAPAPSNKRKSDSSNIPDAKKKLRQNEAIPSSDTCQNSSTADQEVTESLSQCRVEENSDNEFEITDPKDDTFDEDLPSDFE